MRTDSLKQYVSLRNSLYQEKVRLEARLQQLNQVLAGTPAPAAVTVKPAPRTRKPRTPRPAKGGISMRAAVIKATTGNPLTKPEIMAAIKKLGWSSSSTQPQRMLDNVLYGDNPPFKRDNGKFSPLSGGAGSASAKPTAKAGKPSKSSKSK